MSELLAQHLEHKKRLQRINSAAIKKSLAVNQVKVEVQEISLPPPPPKKPTLPPTIIVTLSEGDLEPVRKLALHDIKRLVAKYFGYPVALLDSPTRCYPIVRARHIFCYIARHHLTASTIRIGRSINRDHTTAIHAIARITKLINAADAPTIFDVAMIQELIEEKLCQA